MAVSAASVRRWIKPGGSLAPGRSPYCGFSVRGRLAAGMLRGVGVTFIFLMLVLKIPIAGLLYIVWYAIKSPPEPAADW